VLSEQVSTRRTPHTGTSSKSKRKQESRCLEKHVAPMGGDSSTACGRSPISCRTELQVAPHRVVALSVDTWYCESSLNRVHSSSSGGAAVVELPYPSERTTEFRWMISRLWVVLVLQTSSRRNPSVGAVDKGGGSVFPQLMYDTYTVTGMFQLK